MATSITDTRITTALIIQYCPLCGAVLDPGTDQILCPTCEADEAAKWADYQAEREQAYHPY